MTWTELKEKDAQYVMHTYGRFPVGIKSGKGAVCEDFEGKSYIDLSSGIGVNSFGFADDVWAQAVAEQALKMQHISNLYYTEPCVKAAELLCQKTGMSKVFFGNSGAEANEGAIKAARKYSWLKYGEGRANIITLVNSFHGRTVTTLAATGQTHYHQFFFPFTEGFDFAEANNIESVKNAVTEKTCAVMIELIQGEGGVLTLDQEFVQAVAALCEEKDLVLIVDEVQTGVGRTGSLYAFQQFGIQPDLVTSAKGLGAGLPLGAVLFSKKMENSLQPGDHASTFGGNPVVTAGACTVLERMDEAFLAEVKKKGEYLKEKLLSLPQVEDVSGLGLMIGFTLKDHKAAADAVKVGIEEGLLLLTAKHKVRLLPPLTITYAEIDEALVRLSKTLSRL